MTTPSSDTIAQLPSPRSWLIASIAGLLCLFQLVLQSLPSVIRARIACGFSLSHAGFGGLSSSFYYPYAANVGGLARSSTWSALTPVGRNRDLYRLLLSRRVFPALEAARILMGFGSAPTFVHPIPIPKFVSASPSERPSTCWAYYRFLWQ